MLKGESYFDVIERRVANPQADNELETYCDLLSNYWGFWVVGTGTLIWAFGDLAVHLF